MKSDEPASFTRNATITEPALLHLIVSSIETYKKETFGLLLGEVHKKHYLIKEAIPVQTAKRAASDEDRAMNIISAVPLMG